MERTQRYERQRGLVLWMTHSPSSMERVRLLLVDLDKGTKESGKGSAATQAGDAPLLRFDADSVGAQHGRVASSPC